MADNVQVDNGSLTPYDVASNELAGGEQAQVIQLLASDAATADDRIPASETDGLLVNLGANNDVTVTGTVTVGAAIPAGTNNIGDVDVASIAAGDNNIGNVDIVTMPNVTLAAGTNTNEVVGDGAHDAAVAGNPLLIAFESKDQDGSALPNAVAAEGRAVRGAASLSGVQYVMPVNEDGSAVATVNVNSHAVTNAGTFAVQVDGNALTALQLIDDTVFADDIGFTAGTSKVSAVGMLADEASTDSVDENDIGAPRMTLDRKQIVVNQPHTAGGCTIHRSIDLDEGTLEVVKASPGCVYGMWVANTATSTRFIKFYDATSGTYGTGTPVLTIPIPGNSSDDVGGVFNVGGLGITFATGISVGAGTGVADNDTGAPGANEVIVNIFYK